MKIIIITLYENNHYNIRKIASFWICIFLFTIKFQCLFDFRDQRRLLLSNSVLFAHEIPKKLKLQGQGLEKFLLITSDKCNLLRKVDFLLKSSF